MDYKTKIKYISWNVRGLGQREKRLAVRQSVLLQQPDILCLQETKLQTIDDVTLKEICGRNMGGFVTLNAIGSRGGVLIAWQPRKYDLVQTEQTAYALTVRLLHKELQQHIVFTGVYGPTRRALQEQFYQDLREADPGDNTPWLICGDFNEVLSLGERNNTRGDWRRPLRFANLISQLGLMDLPLQGRRFTWSSTTDRPAMAKLDRFLISTTWNGIFPNSKQTALANTSSDHCPILYEANTEIRKSAMFRFENMWLRSQDFIQHVKQIWEAQQPATTPMQLHCKMQHLQKEIRTWTKGKIGNVKKQIKVCIQFIEWIERVQEVRQMTHMEKCTKALLKRRFTILSVMEEDWWRQRAKIKWDLHGDMNTKVFHAYATTSRRTNHIGPIRQGGVTHTKQTDKARIFRDYYIDLMGTQRQIQTSIQWEVLYPEQFDLQHLQQPITVQELQTVIEQLPNNKAPGPDGFTGEFYKIFKEELIPDIHRVLTQVMASGQTLQPLNASYLILIPKTDHATEPTEFRPISLVHGIQKIFSKILANRIQGHINQIIHQAQTGFIKGRQISEGFIYAREVLQNAKQNNIPLAIFKADIHKAFDTIGWQFLLKVMEKLGFPSQWISWVQNMVLQGSSQIIINGLVGKKIQLRRGVRQGDPLSPLLFIMAVDFLPRWMENLTNIGAMRLPYRNLQPCLLYADDALFFIKPEDQQAQILKLVLQTFGLISGLTVNLQKSEIVATGVQDQRIREISTILACNQGTFPFKYLGLPLSDSKLHKHDFIPIIDKMNARLSGWASKFLTMAGRVVLINSVLTALPVYFMSVCKIPVWALNEMDTIRRNFLWNGSQSNQNKIHLANWNSICMPKKLGGLGIIELRKFNLMLLAKWRWQWQNSTERMWKTLIHQLYGGNEQNGFEHSFLNRQHVRQTTSFMNAFMTVIPVQGNKIRVWDQDWGQGVLRFCYSELYSHCINTQQTLSQARMDDQLHGNFRPLLTELANDQLQLFTYNLRSITMTAQPNEQDGARWGPAAGGEFSVKSAYYQLVHTPMIATNIGRIWKLKVPPRFVIFAWLLIQNKILTHENLRKRGFSVPSICYLCRASEESTRHMFNACPFSREVYRQTSVAMGNTNPHRLDMINSIIAKQIDKEEKAIILINIFIVWRERCNRIFKEQSKTEHHLAEEVLEQWGRMQRQ